MSIFTAVATYIVLWWLSFFLVLPFGAHSQADEGEVVPGSEPGAPHKTNLVKKALTATILAFVFLMAFLLFVNSGILDPYESNRDPWAKSSAETP